MTHHQAQTAIDELDPHGFQSESHGDHVIVDWRVLLAVLLALLFFTVLTTAASAAERWIAHEFMVTIPGWISVVGALTIAVIKATLVSMYFMQLRYDKPLNAIVFVFCLVALAIFLGFSALDLGARDLVYDYKGGVLTVGGNAQSVGQTGGHARLGPRVNTMNRNMVEYARQKFIDEHGGGEVGLAAWKAEMARHDAKHGVVHEGPVLSDANRSIRRTGITPHLYDESVPADEHAAHESNAGGGHGDADSSGDH
ncbi:MAG: hypothetical protein D6695_07870 [Planctomycetota bacterium]|nr:MAG: hypothetical protein D6695_07870 [Planctomycetota bacterium]